MIGHFGLKCLLVAQGEGAVDGRWPPVIQHWSDTNVYTISSMIELVINTLSLSLFAYCVHIFPYTHPPRLARLIRPSVYASLRA